MSDLLRIGASGVYAYRSALSAVGDNVANAETEGFSRRTVRISESPTSFGTSPLYRDRSSFGGADVGAVGRAWDDFKAAESRISASDNGRADARLRWLSTTEAALDDGDTGAGTKLTAFFTAADALAADPNGELPRRAMLAALDEATGAIRTTADALARTADGIAAEARMSVEAVNADMRTLGKLNLALRRAGVGTPVHASLLDERDRLIDRIAASIGIEASFDEAGATTLTLAGSAGKTLVSGTTASVISLTQASDGRLALTVTRDGETQIASPTSGSLAGLVDVAQTVAGRRTQLDAIAADFAAEINAWSANGIDRAGNPGGPLLAGGGAAALRLAISDPDAIAAASTDRTLNGNLRALQGLRTAGMETRLAAVVAGHAQQVASARSEAAATLSRRDGAFAARDEISGIDLDREAAELIRFQQAYDGSAKIIQVARETLQTILNLF